MIPGATYRIYDTSMGDGDNPQLRKEFTVKPGETLDLGDIRIEKPPNVTHPRYSPQVRDFLRL